MLRVVILCNGSDTTQILLNDVSICSEVERPHQIVSDQLLISIVKDNDIETLHGSLLGLFRVSEFPMMDHDLSQP